MNYVPQNLYVYGNCYKVKAIAISQLNQHRAYSPYLVAVGISMAVCSLLYCEEFQSVNMEINTLIWFSYMKKMTNITV